MVIWNRVTADSKGAMKIARGGQTLQPFVPSPRSTGPSRRVLSGWTSESHPSRGWQCKGKARSIYISVVHVKSRKFLGQPHISSETCPKLWKKIQIQMLALRKLRGRNKKRITNHVHRNLNGHGKLSLTEKFFCSSFVGSNSFGSYGRFLSNFSLMRVRLDRSDCAST